MVLSRKTPANAASGQARTEPRDYAGSFRALAVFISVVFAMLLLRFWYLQVI